MIDATEIRLTDKEANDASYGCPDDVETDPMAMIKRRLIANAQLSKALWTIVDQLRTQGTLASPSMDDLTAAAILEQIAIIIETPHPTTQN